jgi:hypothetical protein
VTDEKEDVVDKWFATKKKTGYPIVILDGALEKVLGVKHFPFNGVIDPEGKIAYAGDSPEGVLKKAMKAAKPGSMWPKKVMTAAVLLRNGKIGEAWVELQTLKTASDLDEREKTVSEKFITYVSDVSASTVKSAEALLKDDRVYAALKKAESIASAKPELPATPDAVKLVDSIKALPTFELEMKGGEIFAGAFAKEEAQDFAAAVNGYKDVIKKAEGSKIAAVAKKQAEKLIQKGMPGFEPACEKCHKASKACEKHAKPMKL